MVMYTDKTRLAVSQTTALDPRVRIHRKSSVDLILEFQAKMKSLLLLLLVTFAKASPTFEEKLVSSVKHQLKYVLL